MNQPELGRRREDRQPQPDPSRSTPARRRALIMSTTQLLKITAGQLVAYLLHDGLDE